MNTETYLIYAFVSTPLVLLGISHHKYFLGVAIGKRQSEADAGSRISTQQ